MQTSIFDNAPEILRLPDATLKIFPAYYSEQDINFQFLANNLAWQQNRITVYGKNHITPRLEAWYGDHNAYYQYSSIKLKPSPWTKELSLLKASVEQLSGFKFNSLLANYYRNEKDSVGWHSDDEPELGLQPSIASLSFGDTRTFELRHKQTLEKRRVDLKDGDVLLMSGKTQKFWEHQIPKQSKVSGGRINLTFRMIKN